MGKPDCFSNIPKIEETGLNLSYLRQFHSSPFTQIKMPAIIVPLSHYISRNIKKLWSLSFLAKNLSMSVAKQENLRNQLIGLDRIKRKLLLIRKEKDEIVCCVVNLQDVQHCSVKKVYSSIHAGDLRTKSLNHYLQSVSLQLGFKGGAKPVAVSFYERRYNSMKQLGFLEATAKKWEQFVSELLSRPITEAPV